MKKKLLVLVVAVMALCVMLAISISAAQPVIYDDAPTRTNIEVRTDDLIVFDDGFTTLSAYVVKDSKTLEWKQNAYDFTYINGKTGKTYGYDNIKELDIPQGVTSIATSAFASNHNIVRVSFPDSVTTLGNTIFEYSKSLTQCTFEHNENSALDTLPSWIFAHCVSLTAISLPDCIKYIKGNTQLGGCTSLTAVYLPKNLISSEGGGNTSGTFGGCTNMYFVNEPFTYDNIPSKPDVYYFPAGYKSITGEAFDTCKNLNNVLVFSADGITFDNEWTFEETQNGEGGKPTVVFTGDVSSVSVGSWNVSAIYFSNANDVDATSAGVSGSKTIYYCNAQGNTKHLASPRNSTIEKATCYSNEKGVTRCFCNFKISEGETPNTKLDHTYVDDFDCTTPNKCKEFANCGAFLEAAADAHSEKHAVAYADGFAKGGLHTVWCDNAECKALDKEITLEAIFGTTGGYAISADGGLAGGWTVNSDNFNLYNRYNENDIKFGVLMVNPNHLASTKIFNDDMSVNLAAGKKGALVVSDIGTEYSSFKFSISGFVTEELQNLELIVTAFAYVDGEDVEFIQAENTACKVTTTDFEDGTLYTVNYATAKSALTVEEIDAIVPSKEY